MLRFRYSDFFVRGIALAFQSNDEQQTRSVHCSSQCCFSLQYIDSVQVIECDLQPLDDRQFTLAQPGTRIVVFLVRFVLTLRIAELALQVSLVGLVIILHYNLDGSLP